MTTPEGKIKNKLDAMLKMKRGIWWFKPQAGQYGRSGVPDYIVCVRGKFLSVETKADAKKPMTALQQQCSEKIQNANGTFFLVYNPETITLVEEWIDLTNASF